MHNETKTTAISPEVKQKVYERDNGRCVICGKPGLPEAHFIRRSQGGLGIEENIVTLCRLCHDNFDRRVLPCYEDIIREHLEEHYPDWDESKLIYKKYGGIFDD